MAVTSLGAELPFLDSFDHYATQAHMARKWSQSATSLSFVAGRDGIGQAIKNPGQTQVFKTFINEYTQLSIGVAFKQSTFFGTTIIAVGNVKYGGALPGNVLFTLSNVGDGRLKVGFSGVETIVPGFVGSLNAYYDYELKCTWTYVAGHPVCAWEVKVNETSLGTGTSTCSFATADATMANVWIGGLNPAFGDQFYDDFYCFTGEFLGDVRIVPLYPNGAGAASVWTPNGAGANYQCVQEHDPDDLTTYVSSATPGDVDDYQMDDIVGTPGVIKAVQALWCAQKSEAGTASITGQLISGADTDNSPEYFISDAGWRYWINGYRKSPFTGIDFTKTEINAIKQGQTRMS